MNYLNCSCEENPIQTKETGVFEGYASVFGLVDQQNESVAPGAFQRSLAQWKENGRLPKLLWQHDPNIPIGFWESLVEDDVGLFVRGRLLLDVQHGREAYSLLRSGVVDGLSIGYLAQKSHSSGRVTILDDVDLFEVSLVTFEANPSARVTSFKRWSDPFIENADLLARLQKLKRSMKRTDSDWRSLSEGGTFG